MSYKKHLKTGIRLIIEGDGNPITIVIRASKNQLFKILDTILPDDVEGQERGE